MHNIEKRISIIVPVYNEEGTISELLTRLLRVDFLEWQRDIIIVDDASTDSTKSLIREAIVGQVGITLVEQKINKGKGSAIRTGLAKINSGYVIIQDADLEYSPEEIPKLLEDTDSKGVFVFGSRFISSQKRDTPYSGHVLVNKLFTQVFNVLNKTHLTDMETCYKLFPKVALSGKELTEKGFGIEPELAGYILSSYPHKEVPITYNARTYAEGKKITIWDAISSMRAILVHSFYYKKFIKPFVLFGLIAVTGIFIDISFLYMFVEFFGIYLYLGIIFAFVTSLCVTFFFNYHITFPDAQEKFREGLGKFILVSVFGLLGVMLLMFFFVEVVDLYYIYARVISGAIMTLVTFHLHRLWTFRV